MATSGQKCGACGGRGSTGYHGIYQEASDYEACYACGGSGWIVKTTIAPPPPEAPKATPPPPRAGEWIGTVKRLPVAADHPGGLTRLNHWGQPVPIEHVPCLIVREARPREVILRQWNLVHQCWDEENGADHYCPARDVIWWRPAPLAPFTPPAG